MYSLSGFQFYQRQNEYKRLSKEGIITTAELTYTAINWIICEYRFEFTKLDGTKYFRNSKSIDERNDNIYDHRPKIIYLTNEPQKYWELKDFNSYSQSWSIFFFFGLYGLIGTFVINGFLLIANYLRFKTNRDIFMKELKRSSLKTASIKRT
jgi:hypothetical protein